MRIFLITSLLVLLLFSAEFSYPAVGSPLTTIYVNPFTSTVKLGQTFTINIKISDVTDLYGWELKLGWTPTLLEALDIIQGSFLSGSGETYWIEQIDNTTGIILAACTLVGNRPGVNGSGTLCSVSFYAEALGESVLGLYDTKLVDSFEQLITHAVNHGSVTVSESVGGFLIPVDKLELLAPYIGLASAVTLAICLIVVFAKRRERKDEPQKEARQK